MARAGARGAADAVHAQLAGQGGGALEGGPGGFFG